MLGNVTDTHTDIYQRLISKAGELSNKVETSKQNRIKIKEATDNIKVYSTILASHKVVQKEISGLIDEIVEYLSTKKKNGSMAVNAALMSAKNVIPDSMDGVKLAIADGEAWLESPDGLLVERMEGGGFRATCSLFMRKVALSASPNTMQLLVLDELLAKLSPESSAIVSTYLPLLAQSMQIIIIEQKREVYANAECKTYNFFLADGATVVREEGADGSS